MNDEHDPVLCHTCGYPLRRQHPRPLVKLKPLSELDPEAIAVLEACKRAAKEVATWPAWKANECRCPVT